MIQKVFTVFDAKLNAHKHPHYMTTKGEALREFGNVCANKDTQLNRHPEDFSLYLVAEYDDSTGKYTNLDIPELVATALDFKPSTKEIAQ